jgi:Glycosyl hydrolases family 18
MRGPVTSRLPRAIAAVAATVLAMLSALTARPESASAATQIQVYGTWLCGTDECTWASVPNMTTFDADNHWLINRGDGTPSVNLVVLAFANPLKLLNQTTDSGDVNGVPAGMTSAVVNYFTSHGIRVMLSVGGATYTSAWDTALSQNPSQLGLNAAAVARQLGVGIEIDYENSSSPNLTGLQAFITAYRSQEPYDATGSNPAARLTIDLAAGDQYLTALDRYATQNWLTTSNPVLDYANAMVASKQLSTSRQEEQWQEHVSGEPQYGPPVPPLAPAKFAGSVYITGSQIPPECNDFAASLESSTGSFVQNVAPAGAGTTPGMIGYMFWASGQPSTRGTNTFPPNTCLGGVGTGSSTYSIPIPMPALRQS